MDATHEVFNQPEPLADYNLFDANRPLRDALEFNAPQLQLAPLEHLGDVLGSREMQVHARLANTHPPVLHTHDRFGNRIDEVEFHPAWHELMQLGITHGTHSLPWTSNKAGAHAARAALMMISHQVEEGHSCPITMSFAVVPSLRIQPELASEWEPRVLSNEYDPRFIPAQDAKAFEEVVWPPPPERPPAVPAPQAAIDLRNRLRAAWR